MCVLDDVNACSLVSSGCESFAGVRCIGFSDGDCLWDLSLGQCTGDGKFDWEVFWVGCGWFFLGGGGEGDEELQDTYCSLFSQDDARFQTALFMLYIIY
jgi:hypothetical protein